MPVIGLPRTSLTTARIEGTAIRVVVGEHQSCRSFILPVSLLCHYSNYFHQQVSQLRSAAFSSTSTNKKRKIAETDRQDNSTESTTKPKETKTTIKIESDTDEEEEKEKVKKPEWGIRLPEVDPAIFCLFLHYIYKDAYPASTDINTAQGMGQQYAPVPPISSIVSMAHHPKPTQPSFANNEGQRASTPIEISSSSSALSMPPTAHSSSSPKPKTSSMKPIPAPKPTVRGMLPIAAPTFIPQPLHHYPIPPSIQAHHLSQTLGSPSFTHYTLTRIRMSLGRHFPLTPSLTKHIWTHFPAHSPLCVLILRFLIANWSHPDPRRYNECILRDGAGWDRLFEEERGLRNEFIGGMQGRGLEGDWMADLRAFRV